MKHLSALDRLVLNRFRLFGVSNTKRAREAEAIEASAQALNGIADLIDVSPAAAPKTNEDRALIEAYFAVYVGRPK